MMGRNFLAWVTVGILVVIGMLTYPFVHTIWGNLDVTGWPDLLKAVGVLMSYGFIGWFIYIGLHHVKGGS